MFCTFGDKTCKVKNKNYVQIRNVYIFFYNKYIYN